MTLDASASADAVAPDSDPVGRTRLDRTSLRVKLVLAVVLLSAVVLLLSGVVATTALRGFLHDQLDDRLTATVGQIEQRLTERGPGSPEPVVPPNYFAQLRAADGTVGDTANEAEDDGVPDLPDLADMGTVPFTVSSVGGDTADWRVLAEPIGDDVTLVVATSMSEVNGTVEQLVLLQSGAGLIALVALGFVGSWVIRRSLRPLEEIESVAGDIAAGDLARRVPDPDERTEVGRLAGALNGMLVQIESAVRDREVAATTANQSEQRMRRFVADASHELRTPLTSIRGFAELYRQGAVPAGPEVGRVMSRIESEAGRMNMLVEDMLLLARLDERRPMRMVPVDLLPLAVDAVYDARAVAPGRGITLAAGDGPRPVVRGDEARLRQVLGNLLANALIHTPDGTPVDVRVSADAASVVLEVADRGTGLEPEQAARVFERFYRADAARARAEPAIEDHTAARDLGAGGSGLGLSIVAAVAAAHGGRVGLDTAPGQGATFRVVLPRLTEGPDGGAEDADEVPQSEVDEMSRPAGS
jgi:two-component system OmpR family sensor kinase